MEFHAAKGFACCAWKHHHSCQSSLATVWCLPAYSHTQVKSYIYIYINGNLQSSFCPFRICIFFMFEFSPGLSPWCCFWNTDLKLPSASKMAGSFTAGNYFLSVSLFQFSSFLKHWLTGDLKALYNLGFKTKKVSDKMREERSTAALGR